MWGRGDSPFPIFSLVWGSFALPEGVSGGILGDLRAFMGIFKIF